MNTWNDIDHLERRLKASIISLNKRKLASPTIVEAIDDEGIWPDDFVEFANWLPPRTNVETLLRRAPLLLCAAATEIGFRYEGVGTVFWDRLSDALGMEISLYQRQQIADEFKSLALRYKLAEPPRTAFSQHFSLIAWPISQALLPIDLIDPVMRMLSAAPVSALPAAGKTANFTSLRAWSGAAEGVRLTDWLRIEAPAERVLNALLYDNRGSPLSPVAYRRIADRITLSNNAPAGLKRAKARVRSTKTVDSGSQTFGRLTLMATGSPRLLVSWPAFPISQYEDGRLQARAKNWRPQLWGAGPFLHPDNALGGGPFSLSMAQCPAVETPAYPNTGEVFGVGKDITLALAARTVDWTALLLFDADDETKTGEQRLSPFNGLTGKVFVGTKSGNTSLSGLRTIGRSCGYDFYTGDLSQAEDLAILRRAGAWSEKPVTMIARHPVDSMGASSGVVRPGRPFLVFDSAASSDDFPAPQTIEKQGLVKLAGIGQLRCEAQELPDPGLITVTLADRDYAFDALIERRLELRFETSLPLRDIPVRAVLSVSDKLIAVGQTTLTSFPATVDARSDLLVPLHEDRVRRILLTSGQAVLGLSVGNTLIASIALQRPAALVVWSEDGYPELVTSSASSKLVTSDAHHPHLFREIDAINPRVDSVSAFGLRLPERGVIDPIRLIVPDRISFSDLSSDFGSEISRRLFDDGLGSGDLARAKINWSRAVGDGLLALGVKERIVRQFDAPLVERLCGRTWRLTEEQTQDEAVDPHHALWRLILKEGLAKLPFGQDDIGADLFLAGFRRHAAMLDPDWPSNTDVPQDGMMDEALNRAFVEAYGALQERGLFLDVDTDFDFGTEAEKWSRLAADALRVTRRVRLAKLIAPPDGGRQLSRRSYNVGFVDLAEDLAAWTRQFALPRGQMASDLTANCLHLWLAPAACDDPMPALKVLASDPFVSRAIRYAALRYRSTISGGIA
ncbi:hypothetical protein E0H35_30580 [Rhizobium leguminosarum bv. viciae]|uniref:hypothetical protein n=1 Tax=Rhizobium leguminosarum TaxID=384 RepID=UPI00103C40A3|nr:hypothetical protein [Rhizobium leguminosarum]MBY5340440.1 hypothetical protein [Rhizobium leguminosarum]NKK49341.1 hypothetical protein [Rhizobium leguminosarum bv. viciae]TBY90881.1 hypothetical protein E0H35_30580 [Rhizobium leguminosarum bv. viciae]